MKRKIIGVLLTVVCCVFFTCCGNEKQNNVEQGKHVFTDALGRKISIIAPERVGIASGSLAECWMLAGGTAAAVTQDAVDERNLELPEDAVNLGSLKDPSLETILAAKLDFLILMPSLKSHLALAETLDKAGITYAYFDVETFDDYLELLKIFTDITNRPDLYEKNGAALKPRIEKALEEGKVSEQVKVLLLRASASRIKAQNSDSMVGAMLKEFGCINIADSDTGLSGDLSIEGIVKEDPDYIFVVCMGDVEEAKIQYNTLSSNPIWKTLQAVENGNCKFLEKELFHYKPNARWGESYEKLAELLSEN